MLDLSKTQWEIVSNTTGLVQVTGTNTVGFSATMCEKVKIGFVKEDIERKIWHHVYGDLLRPTVEAQQDILKFVVPGSSGNVKERFDRMLELLKFRKGDLV